MIITTIIIKYNNGIKRELPEISNLGVLFFKTVPIQAGTLCGM